MPEWSWDESQSESGVVHQSTPNTDHDDATELKQGYDYANFSEIAPDPVACWPLHEDSGTTAYDVAGANDGTYVGPTLGQVGLLGTTTPSLDGVDDYIDCGSGISWTFPFTICSWFKTSSSDRQTVFGDYAGNASEPEGPEFHLLEINNDAAVAQIRDSNGNIIVVNGSSTVTDGVFHHCVGVFTSSDVMVYVDGTQEGSGTHSVGPDVNSGADDWIGAWPQFGGGSYLTGNVADTRVYDTDLTQTEIQALYDVVDTDGTWTGTAKTL